MPQPNDYFAAMGGAANIGGINQSIQQTLLGQQNIQQNQNILAQQEQAQQAERALAMATDPNAPPEIRQQAMAHLQQVDPAKASALRVQQQRQADLNTFFQKPNDAAALRVLTLYPDLHESLTAGMKGYNEAATKAKVSLAADVAGYLDNNDQQGALAAMQAHMQADEAAGLPVDGYGPLLTAVRTNPVVAKGLAHLMVVSANPEKIGENASAMATATTTDALRPSAVAKAGAEASTAQTEAQFKPQMIQSDLQTAAAQRQRMADQSVTDLMNARTAQGTLSLNRDRLDFDVQAHIDDIEQKVGKLTPGSEKIVNDSSAEAAAKQQVAEQEKGLAARIRQSGLSAGPRASVAEAYKSIWGTQDAYTQIRNEYNRLRNSAAMANKSQMPGSMSNADRDFLLQGMPPPNANPEHIAKFLDIMAKAHEGMAKQEDAKAIWAATNGNLGPATRPFVIDGYRIPKGMTLAQHQSALAKINGPGLPADAEAVAARARGQ